MCRVLRALTVGLCSMAVTVPAMALPTGEPPAPPSVAEEERHTDALKREYDRVQRHKEEIERRGQREQERADRLLRFLEVRPGQAPPPISIGKSWLGVQLCPVPAALAEHLRIENKGVMVCNVFKDSPADKAGIERYDVIVSADGKPAEGGMEAVPRFSESVREKEPGDTLQLGLIHQGREKELNIELVAPPRERDRMELKYEEDPDLAYSRALGLRGQILRPGPHGWTLEDLGEFPGLRDRLERHFLPPLGARERERDTRRNVEEARRVDKDGNTLHVRRDENGRITVQRSKAGENRDPRGREFRSMEELRREDPEAFDLLQSALPKPPSVRPVPQGPGVGPRAPVPPLPPRDARKPAEPPLPQAGPGDDSTREQRWREWERRFFQAPLPDPRPGVGVTGPARTRFEVAPDGKITVHTRDGDTEMSRTYPSREALREQAPRLFERFKDMEARFQE